MNLKTYKIKWLFLKILVVAISIVVVIKCKKDKDDAPTPTPTPTAKPEFTLMTNGADPLFLSALTPEGKTVEYYGTRDANGIPTSVTDITIKSSTETLKYKVDETGRPLKMIANDGTEFDLTWIADDHVAVTVTSSDGNTQVNMELKDLKNPNKVKPSLIANGDKINRIGKPIKGAHNPFQETFKKNASMNGNVTVNVSLCGTNANADVYVRATDNTGAVLGEFPGVLVSKGVFSASVPPDVAPTLVPSALCQALAGVLDKLCYIDQVPQMAPLMCPTLAGAISTSGIGAVPAAALFGACEATVAGLLIYCHTLGASAGPGAPALVDAICNADVLKRAFTADVNLTPYAVALPNKVFGNTIKFDPSGSNVVSVDLGTETAIRSFTLNPPAPAAGQSYVAKANIFCLAAGSSVNLAIVGSDGYQNEQTFNITTTEPEAEYSITVPGGAQNVKDKVTLTITLPDGTIIKREAFLVFG